MTKLDFFKSVSFYWSAYFYSIWSIWATALLDKKSKYLMNPRASCIAFGKSITSLKVFENGRKNFCPSVLKLSLARLALAYFVALQQNLIDYFENWHQRETQSYASYISNRICFSYQDNRGQQFQLSTKWKLV